MVNFEKWKSKHGVILKSGVQSMVKFRKVGFKAWCNFEKWGSKHGVILKSEKHEAISKSGSQSTVRRVEVKARHNFRNMKVKSQFEEFISKHGAIYQGALQNSFEKRESIKWSRGMAKQCASEAYPEKLQNPWGTRKARVPSRRAFQHEDMNPTRRATLDRPPFCRLQIRAWLP
ncbi:hypothetical protein METBIDRAFT_171134 [Metschnikowia bicuspidata var. bicuspidata NRRL YB-4993]|uniref:Uncharacterized protein n=1 Tax=Metschnikowia bicuspidata var. bicuspidata NRRL YB-4993 TaxID=869754 RepID=A0A1A0HAU6_9ASCO|nr:hypothetical protein METBIDRAFT_171134 [Metschnikowia bicuspidata var. bicuspidata NRRL YB-4993]OBA21008.1 hypothetical protein METBIDRAFT_171134 [Metschnikowia bicuspidata var. bicuspidata NRRL YB-4993]